MRSDRRDTLSVEDIELATKELNHAELLFSPFDSTPEL
jgi:hypothetical protein